MPNHFHAIVRLLKEQDGGIRESNILVTDAAVCHTALRTPSKTLGAMIRGFKGSVTSKINQSRDTKESPIWQSNYYEHIIRDEKDYLRIAEYIENNPLLWSEDKYFE